MGISSKDKVIFFSFSMTLAIPNHLITLAMELGVRLSDLAFSN